MSQTNKLIMVIRLPKPFWIPTLGITLLPSSVISVSSVANKDPKDAGEAQGLYYLTIKRRFAAAHRLLGYGGECSSLHGHTWTVEVQVSGEQLDSCGMLVDFKILKKMIDGIVSELDHNYINELAHFDLARGGVNPTAENIAAYIFKSAGDQIENLGKELCLQEVKVWESPDAFARYREDK